MSVKFLNILRNKDSFKSFLLNRGKRFTLRISKYVFLIAVSVVFLYPFLYMIITSLKSTVDLADPTVNWVPHTFYWQNFAIAFHLLNFKTGFINSFIIVMISTVGHLFACSFIAYGFARYRFKFRGILFATAILSIIVPVQTLIIPSYIQYSNIGWLNSILPLVIPVFFGYGLNGGVYIFLFRQFYASLPSSLEDAAQIDGCGSLRTYFRIVLPTSRSAVVVGFVLSLVWHWNDYYEPSLYLTEAKRWTLASMLPGMFVEIQKNAVYDAAAAASKLDSIAINEAVVMAATLLVILPVLIAFFFLQKQFMQGIERTGLVE